MRLPINKFMTEGIKKVLNIDTVVEIMANFVESRDWRKAFLKSLPKRFYYKNCNIRKQ
jgi:hypothetical protein